MALDVGIQEKFTISSIQEILTYAGYSSSLLPFKEGLDLHRLLIGPGAFMTSSGTYDYERPFFVTLHFMNDLLQSMGIKGDELMDNLQLTATLPVSIPEAARKRVSLLMNEFNLLLPIGCFVLTDEGFPHFRYSWQVFERDCEGLVIGNMLGTALFFIEKMGYKFEELATGEKSLEQILNEEIDFRT